MATPPVFSAGAVLTAAQMNAVGLWLVKEQAIGTTQTSVTVSSAFSTDFNNYRIVIQGLSASASASTANFLRCSIGNTSDGHYGSLFYDEWTGSSTGYQRTGNGAGWAVCINAGTAGDMGCSFDLRSPFLAQPTTMNGGFYGGGWSGWIAGGHFKSTSYTSFTVSPSSGTISNGSVYVYGYREG